MKSIKRIADYKVDSRSSKAGWAPGEYLCECLTCNEAFKGDKRAVQCADCAYSPQKLVYILPPEMSDGQHITAVDGKECVMAGFRAWLDEAVEGDSVTVAVRKMTEAELNQLESI